MWQSFYILFPAALSLFKCCDSKLDLWCLLQYNSLTTLVGPRICLLDYLFTSFIPFYAIYSFAI